MQHKNSPSEHREAKGDNCMPIKLYLQKEVENWIWPVGQALVTGPFPFGMCLACNWIRSSAVLSWCLDPS